MRHLKIALFFFGLLLFGCQESLHVVVLSTEKEFIDFSLEKSLNPSLDETVTAEIINSEIWLIIPELADKKQLIATFNYKGDFVLVNTKKQESGISVNDYTAALKFIIQAEDGTQKVYSVKVMWKDELKSSLPHIYVDTDDNADITSKKVYVNGTIRIEGKEEYNDFEGRMGIRGRGNTSWGLPKKPYKIKLDSKASLFGMPAYKEWVLLAEYLDGTMLYNSIAFKAGRLLEIPYTNHMIPVELTINGEYQGVYTFTEHKEVGEHRIDIGDDGVLLELDTYFDEDWKFKSEKYDLPVMVQFPKEKDMTQEKLDEIKADFENFEALVYDPAFPNNNYLDYFDDLSFVNYMIVYQLTLNQEINHPKSTYINKLAGGKYRMGIIWDFDWGFGFQNIYKHYDISTAVVPLFWELETAGKIFFSRLMEDPRIELLFKERWSWFKTNKYQELKEYVTSWSGLIGPVLTDDHALWGNRSSSGSATTDLQRVLNWLDARVDYLDSYVSDF